MSEGVRLVYDLDDAVMFKDPGSRNDGRPRRELRFKSAVKRCDLVIAGNFYLRENFLPYNRNVEILPTTLDIRRYRPKALKKKDEIIIGWIGIGVTLLSLKAIKDVFEETRLLTDLPITTFLCMPCFVLSMTASTGSGTT